MGRQTDAKSNRCPWGNSDPDYARYHDEEWGVPHADSQRLFEKIVLEGFQSGLSWLTILRKRESFRRAFHDFDPHRMARYGDKDIARLMADAGIVRHRLKIEAAISNARAYVALSQSDSLARFLWSHLQEGPIINTPRTMADVPASTEISLRMSKALKRAGFRFVGPTTLYAFMQSTGMVNDHLVTCPRHGACAKLQTAFRSTHRKLITPA